MELRHLRVFAAAGQLLNFAQAAEQLGIAQPAVSQQVKALEKELGFALFRRIRRGVELTAAGSAMLPEAVATLAQANRTLRIARSARRGEVGQIRVGYSYSIMGEADLPALIRTFNQTYPVVDFDFTAGSVKDLIDAVWDEDLDVAFVRSPIGKLPAGLMTHPYATSELVIAVSADHPLAKRESLHLAEMTNDNLVLMSDPDGYGLGHQTLDMFRAAGIQPRIGFRLENVIGMIGLVAANSGFAIVPRVLAQTVGSVATIRIEGPPVVSAITIVCRKINLAVHVQRFIKTAVGMA
jgi:DNA-binding transcriptional LysR family regulator